jgi:uncharacterized membrane protein YbhN (UPF0104 family)
LTSDDPDPLLPAKRNGTWPMVWALSVILFVTFSGLGLWLAARVTGHGWRVAAFGQAFVRALCSGPDRGFSGGYYQSDGLRLYYALRALDVTVRFRKLLPLVVINILFSNVTPLASGGAFVQVWYLRRIGVPVGTSAAATTILAMIPIFAAAPVLQFIDPTPALASGMGRIVSQSVSVLVLVYLVGFIILLARGFRQFLAAPLRHSLAAIPWTLIFLLTRFSFPALLTVLLDHQIDWITVLGAVAVVTFLMYFAPLPGGACFAELAIAGLMFTQIGASDLVLVIFVWRFLTIDLGMALGLVVSAMVFAKAGRAS